MSTMVLKQCPFCLGQAQMQSSMVGGLKYCFVECSECKIQTPQYPKNCEYIPAKLWNRRFGREDENDG